MTIDPMQSIAVRILAAASLDRLQRAVTALVEQSVSVHVTRQTSDEIRALVKHGNGVEYGVTLTEALTTCSCKDALYRGVVCKHAVAVALHVLRTHAPKEQPIETHPSHHLLWRDDTVLCGVRQPFATWILDGKKTIELRSWRTQYRGPVVIHASRTVTPGYHVPTERIGALLGVVDIINIRPMRKSDEKQAQAGYDPQCFAWVLQNPRRLNTPIPYAGRLRLFTLPEQILRYLASEQDSTKRPSMGSWKHPL